jgi:hypothetical protein
MCSKYHALAIGAVGCVAGTHCKPAKTSVEATTEVQSGTRYGESLQTQTWRILEQITKVALHEQSDYFVNILSHNESEDFTIFSFPDGFSKILHGHHLMESDIALIYNSPSGANSEVVGKIRYQYKSESDNKRMNPDCYLINVDSIEVPQRQINIRADHILFMEERIEREKHINRDALSEICTNSTDPSVGG